MRSSKIKAFGIRRNFYRNHQWIVCLPSLLQETLRCSFAALRASAQDKAQGDNKGPQGESLFTQPFAKA